MLNVFDMNLTQFDFVIIIRPATINGVVNYYKVIWALSVMKEKKATVLIEV